MRARKQHVQQELTFGAKVKKKRRHRRGSRPWGRPVPRGKRPSERHETRPFLHARNPVHVVIRVTEDVGSLRRLDMYRALRAAIVVTFDRHNFRIVHVSVQGTHVHLLVEADDRLALAEGMKAMQTSAARRINALVSKRRGRVRKGNVFPDRYHAEILTSPTQTRNALSYVLNNWRKHRADGDRRLGKLGSWPCDFYSTGITFDGWADLDISTLGLPPYFEPLRTVLPQTWLLREGWKRAGSIRTTDVPGAGKAHPSFAE